MTLYRDWADTGGAVPFPCRLDRKGGHTASELRCAGASRLAFLSVTEGTYTMTGSKMAFHFSCFVRLSPFFLRGEARLGFSALIISLRGCVVLIETGTVGSAVGGYFWMGRCAGRIAARRANQHPRQW